MDQRSRSARHSPIVRHTASLQTLPPPRREDTANQKGHPNPSRKQHTMQAHARSPDHSHISCAYITRYVPHVTGCTGDVTVDHRCTEVMAQHPASMKMFD